MTEMIKVNLFDDDPEAMAIVEGWKKSAKDVRSPEDVLTFLQGIKDRYEFDYASVVEYIRAGMIAMFNGLASEQGITGFQADFIGSHLRNDCLGRTQEPKGGER